MPRFLFYLSGSRILTNTTRVILHMRFSFAPEILRCIYGYNHGDSSRYPLAVIIRLFDMPVRLFIYYCRKLKTYGLRYMRSVIDYLHALTFFVAHAEVYFQI